MLLELCAYNLESCLIAEKAGAGRIELCSNPLEGGVTPSFGLIATAMERVAIPVYPMLRPRGGNFVYGADELEVMKKDILQCREMGCVGIATGVSLADSRLDADAMKQIVAWAYPMEVTCHKVFDRVPDAYEALDVLLAAGVTRLLTSGLERTALGGAQLIAEMKAYTQGRMVIMPGGGVRAGNLREIAEKTSAGEFHSSGILNMAVSQTADEYEVRAMVSVLKEI
jgi:copper homeostasis protein